MTTAPEIDIRKNVPFGAHDGDVLTGDYYAPPEAGAYPALIALHGGAWKYGTAEGYQYWGPYLAQRGYVLFAINYRLVQGTKHRYPVAVHDTRAAVQFLRSEAAAFKVDPTRIGCRRPSRSIPPGSGAWGTLQAPTSQRSWRSRATAHHAVWPVQARHMLASVHTSKSSSASMASMTSSHNGSMISLPVRAIRLPRPG